jgi:hypothetical protein
MILEGEASGKLTANKVLIDATSATPALRTHGWSGARPR